MDTKLALQIEAEFKGKEPTQDAIDAFLKGKGISEDKTEELALTPERVKDIVFQVDYERRTTALYEKIINVLSKYKSVSLFASQEEQKAIQEHNEKLSEEIATLLEDGINYHELPFLENLGRDLAEILKQAQQAAMNMGSAVLLELAKRELGDPLTMKNLAMKYGAIANEKAEKLST